MGSGLLRCGLKWHDSGACEHEGVISVGLSVGKEKEHIPVGREVGTRVVVSGCKQS